MSATASLHACRSHPLHEATTSLCSVWPSRPTSEPNTAVNTRGGAGLLCVGNLAQAAAATCSRPTPFPRQPPTHLEGILLYDPVSHVGRHLPQHSDHGNVGLASTSGRTHQDVLIAAHMWGSTGQHAATRSSSTVKQKLPHTCCACCFLNQCYNMRAAAAARRHLTSRRRVATVTHQQQEQWEQPQDASRKNQQHTCL